MRLTEDSSPFAWQQPDVDRHVGHAHFWQRALTRRQFLGTAAAAGGAAATAALWSPLLTAAASGPATPRPIPGGTLLPFQPTPFHFYFPTANPFSSFTVENGQGDPSTIFDFKGNVALAELSGRGVGRNTGSETEMAMFWAADVRAMKGIFVGTDSKHHSGAVAFI